MQVRSIIPARTRGTIQRWLSYLDSLFGRGSYYALKEWLDPGIEYTQIIYGQALIDALEPSVRWLDAGCGHEILKHGAGTERFELTSKAQFNVGCDLDMRSLQDQALLANRVCCNLESLPFRSNSFDLVSLNNVAEHLPDPVTTVTEIARVLRDGGRVIVHTPNARSYWVTIARLARLALPERLMFSLIKFLEYREDTDVFPTLYRANTKEQLLEMMANCGMIAERMEVLRSRPLFYFVLPFAALEIIVTRLLARAGMEEFVSPVLLGVFRRATKQTVSVRDDSSNAESARSAVADLPNHAQS